MSGQNLYGSKNIRVLPNNPSTASYCNISAFSPEPVTSVVFSDLTNASDPHSAETYENFLSMTCNVEKGNEYKLTVKGNTYGDFYLSTFTAFVDWNQNGILDDDNEVYKIGYIQGSTGIDDKFAETFIKVPDNAVTGNTRMRILKVYSPSSFAMFWPTGACGNYNYGQTED